MFSASYPLKGKHVFLMLVAFFGFIIAVNAIMGWFALRTMPGTEVKSAYQASQGFQKELDKAKEQDARGWKIDGEVTRTPYGDVQILVTAYDKEEKPLVFKQALVIFRHPADSRGDRRADLVVVKPGLYRASIGPEMPAGAWRMMLAMQDQQGIDYKSETRVHVP